MIMSSFGEYSSREFPADISRENFLGTRGLEFRKISIHEFILECLKLLSTGDGRYFVNTDELLESTQPLIRQ